MGTQLRTDTGETWGTLCVDVGDAPGAEGDGAVKAFGFKDPEGYSLEVFAWVNEK